MSYTWDKTTSTPHPLEPTQYFEMFGNRAIYHDGWIAATTPPEPPSSKYTTSYGNICWKMSRLGLSLIALTIVIHAFGVVMIALADSGSGRGWRPGSFVYGT